MLLLNNTAPLYGQVKLLRQEAGQMLDVTFGEQSLCFRKSREEEGDSCLQNDGKKAIGICEPQKEECFGAYREHVSVGLRLHNYSCGHNGIINNSNICLSQTKGCRCYLGDVQYVMGKILILELHCDSLYPCDRLALLHLLMISTIIVKITRMLWNRI